MTDKPSCETCPYCDKDTGTWDYCNERDFAIDPIHTKEAIELVGCLSHPQAREYLMEPVLKELFPKPTPEDKKSGWEYNYRFIEKIANRTEELSEDFACMETVMVVLKALEESLRIQEQP